MATKKEELTELLEKRQYWWWAEKARSPRLDYLRKAVWSKATKGAAYLPGIKICKYGPTTLAKVFDTDDARIEPYQLTFAKGLAKTCDEIPIYIVDGSRIVGATASAPHKLFWVANGSYQLNQDLFNDRDDLIDTDEREDVQKAMDLLKPYTQQFMTERLLSNRQKIMARTSQTFTGGAHLENQAYCTSQFEYYKKGYNAIMEEIDQSLGEVNEALYKVGAKPDWESETYFLKEDPINRIDNWKSFKIALDGGIAYGKRLARLSRIIAENFETDPVRKEELAEVSERCEWVPGNRPRNFPEALQFEHIHTMCRKREKPAGAWPAHPDWWFWEWYERDVIKEKTLSREDAIDYIGEYLIRAFEYGNTRDRSYRELMTGDPGPYVWTLGGTQPTGGSGYTDLTNAILEAARLTRCVSPTYALRYNKDMPEDVLRNSFECIRHGLGYPNIREDQTLIKANMFWSGNAQEEARTWTAQACIVPCADTKDGCMPARYSASTTLGSKCVELALWNGWNPVFNMQIGPKTGEATSFKNYQEFEDAVVDQWKVIHWEGAKIRQIARIIEECQGRPYLSATYEWCVENGKNAFQRQENGNNWITCFIWMDGLDAMAATKKLVFDEKKYTMEQLMTFLKANWEGYEKERMDFVRAPKWGNDDPYADGVVVRMMERTRDEVCLPCQDWGKASNGIPFVPQNIAAYTVGGALLGALPNGRRLGDTCYDGGCSPGAGQDKKGPTAVLRSIGKMTHENMFRANLLNQRLSPAQLTGEKGFQLFDAYLKAWSDLGINHVQFNMVDNETLLAAQKQPEDYSELTVRVAGYSALFTGLNKKTQDTIIARTIQEI